MARSAHPTRRRIGRVRENEGENSMKKGNEREGYREQIVK